MKKFLRKDDGLVTIEWVGIAAVMVLAAIAITAFVMQGADSAATKVGDGMSSIDIPAPIAPGPFGEGAGTP
jgi:hypothetical protein